METSQPQRSHSDGLLSLRTEESGEEGNRWGTEDSPAPHQEIVVGLTLLLVTAIGGICLAHGSGPSLVDTWFPSFLTSGHHSLATDVTRLRYPQVIVVAAVIMAAIAFPRDRLTSLVCLVGPPLALLSSELVVKHVVGRTLGTGLSYPSGSTVGAAALGTALVLGVPVRLRKPALVVASVYGLWMALAVLSLQWHYPTDAVAGLCYGVGVVLVLDGSVHRAVGVVIGRRTRPRPPASD